MVEEEKPSATADKMLDIVAQMFCLNRKFFTTKSTFEELGITEPQKEQLFKRIADRFYIRLEPCSKVNLHGEGNKITGDLWERQKLKIKTLWNLLQFIESNDDYRNKPAAYNLQ